MLYFSYGSNMSIKRLCARVPSAKFITIAVLEKHELKFHKVSNDGSGKCDVEETLHNEQSVTGVVFDICESEKPYLDLKEGLGSGYDEKVIVVKSTEGESIEAITYYATKIDSTLKPYHWYKEHVIRGAKENNLPDEYIEVIVSIVSVQDPNQDRHNTEMAIYSV